MNQDWIKLPDYRIDSSGRKIFKAKCLKCGNYFINHRHMNKHIKRCKGTENQNRQHNLLLIPQINSDTNQDQNDFLDFHADLVNMFVSANISLSQIDTQVFQNMFLHMGIDKCNIPNSENLRQLIINF